MDAPIIGLQSPALPALPRVSTAKTAEIPVARPTEREFGIESKAEAVDTEAIDHKRLARVQKAAGSIANLYVVSDKVFTIFKDSTGQYVTRFRNLQTQEVTYIPEPELLKRSQDQTTLLNTLA